MRTTIKYAAVTLLAFGAGRLSTNLVASLFEWPRTPEWMDVNATGVVVNGVVAVGTCAAVIVALSLAIRQDQQKRNDDLNRAKLAAAGVSERLKIIRTRANVALQFIEGSKAQITNESIKSYVESLDRIRPISLDEIHALAPLPNHCAPKLAAGLERFVLARSFLEAIGEGPDDSRDDNTLKHQAALLRDARDLLDDARQTIDKSNRVFSFTNSLKANASSEKSTSSST
ncbi:hypothetical protein [Burkholderia cenocepacia]|uniref:hypothetical protein n=1 Tax=Burkholderia cenocepacia TaxID=95486 RepID=UPI00119823F3|nr:hypothetical protein [Burkholderia cenocepacia]MCW3581577.1 hypothetical protein [Burkholderia cenocepacia]MCW3626849.1 hypothetical protein [Burkholderia cenocepacia]MCW5178985.1 hypothetical protein [Burkholderia cenocepacia]